MSNLTASAKCPGCGQRYAPDDGMCCVPCAGCGKLGKWQFLPWVDGHFCDGCLLVMENTTQKEIKVWKEEIE